MGPGERRGRSLACGFRRPTGARLAVLTEPLSVDSYRSPFAPTPTQRCGRSLPTGRMRARACGSASMASWWRPGRRRDEGAVLRAWRGIGTSVVPGWRAADVRKGVLRRCSKRRPGLRFASRASSPASSGSARNPGEEVAINPDHSFLLRLDAGNDELLEQLRVLNGYDTDLAADATRLSNRLRDALTSISAGRRRRPRRRRGRPRGVRPRRRGNSRAPSPPA